MPVPKYRTSASKRDMRRSHHKLSAPALGYCPTCGKAKAPHVICSSCGHYKGTKYLKVSTKDSNWGEESSNTPATK